MIRLSEKPGFRRSYKIVSDGADVSRKHLRSAASHQLVVPSLSLEFLRDPVHTTSVFACLLKTFLFSEY